MLMELSEHSNGKDSNESRDTLLLFGGAAIVLFGAGLILSTPIVRRSLGGVAVGNLLQAAIPDFQRYLRLRSM